MTLFKKSCIFLFLAIITIPKHFVNSLQSTAVSFCRAWNAKYHVDLVEIVLTSIRCPWAEDSCRHNTRRRTKASSSNPNNGHVALVTNTTALHHCISCSCDLIHWFSSPFTTDNTLPVVAMTVYLGGCCARDASSFRRQWQRQPRRLKRQENKVPCIWRATYLWRKNHCANFLDTEIGISFQLYESRSTQWYPRQDSVRYTDVLSFLFLLFEFCLAYQYCRNDNLAMVFFDCFINLRPRCLYFFFSSIVQQYREHFFREL